MGYLKTGRNQTVKVMHTKKERKNYFRKGGLKDKNAKQCIGCESNTDGFCKNYRAWCYNARIYCPKCKEKPRDYYRK